MIAATLSLVAGSLVAGVLVCLLVLPVRGRRPGCLAKLAAAYVTMGWLTSLLFVVTGIYRAVGDTLVLQVASLTWQMIFNLACWPIISLLYVDLMITRLRTRW